MFNTPFRSLTDSSCPIALQFMVEVHILDHAKVSWVSQKVYVVQVQAITTSTLLVRTTHAVVLKHIYRSLQESQGA